MSQVVVFSADWCVYCKPIKTALRRQGIRYRVMDVDTPAGSRLADRLRVRGIPAVFVLGDDDEYHRVTDPTPRRVRAALERHG
ncbi:MAG: glutaredoxin family protein [Deltaproteobacteria bacterium]|nr:glutaredoxin family protein [Deltaproteobacteria bacterium]